MNSAIEYRDDLGDASYILKRIEKHSDGSYLLVSQNRAYQSITVDPNRMSPFARLKEVL